VVTPPARLESVNLARVMEPGWKQRIGQTGIDKRRVDRPVRTGADVLVGDTICDTASHGGAGPGAVGEDISKVGTGHVYKSIDAGKTFFDISGDLPNAPATDADSLSGLQWDMRQIHTPEAHAITGGSPAVLVGDIDTGIDFNHPDLRQNIDVANSANCISGAPVPGLAAQDDNGHGTHTMGTIAASGAGGAPAVGVAPGVRCESKRDSFQPV